jgi:drug/metabolite transporter (DMT)-like permease
MAHDEYIGVTLAVCSSIAVGTSYVTTKVGLKDASQRHGFNGDGHEYFRNPIWWTGMVMLVLGEIFNFAAYAFAPAILVTPLGALSVLTGTILGAYFLGERLSVIGRLGCALCLIGSVLIVANAPPDQEIETVNEILQFAVQPGKPFNPAKGLFVDADTLAGFLFFCFVTAVFTVVMIYFVCPKYGTVNPVFYLSICASTGAVSVMALKAFGIAIKLTFAGENQFIHLSTYFFATVAIGCIVVQMNYFNKALSTFSQSL